MVVVSGQCIRLTLFRDKSGNENSSIRVRDNNDKVWSIFLGRSDSTFKDHPQTKLMTMEKIYITTSASDNGELSSQREFYNGLI